MKFGFFITGTDTSCGKTHVSMVLLYALAKQGLSTAAMKPVASGCQITAHGLRNEDALLLQQTATVAVPYELINPYALRLPIAPHLAAKAEGVTIKLDHLMDNFATLARQAEALVVEGAGGWLVPLNSERNMADLARRFSLPVILVVGIRLGCINHALLTVESLQREKDNPPLCGWVANCIDHDTRNIEGIIATLKENISAPLLGTLPYIDTATQADNKKARHASIQAGLLNIHPLIADTILI